MKAIKSKILGFLLHHANRNYRSPEFYAIKSKIIGKYGSLVGIDIQHLEGVKCTNCSGTGVHHYDYHGFPVECHSCWNGWYKPKAWVILYKYVIGNYSFHQPIQKFYHYPTCQEFVNTMVSDRNYLDEKVLGSITGYIDHTRSKHGDLAYMILGSIFDHTNYWKRWFNGIGRGWACYWWRPRNWVNNIAHIIRYKKEAIPFDK